MIRSRKIIFQKQNFNNKKIQSKQADQTFHNKVGSKRKRIFKIPNWEKYLDHLAKNTIYTARDGKQKVGKKREPILIARNVDVIYKTTKGPFKAVKNVSLNLFKGEILGLVGETGSGKSSFGKALTKQVNHRGTIIIDGLELPNKASRVLRRDIVKKIQMIFQDPTDSLNPYKSVGTNFVEGLGNITPKSFFRNNKKSLINSKKVKSMIESIGFDQSIMRMFPLELSGGQQQRVSIGRALLVNPKVLIADEPISALDVSIQAQVINILSRLKEERELSIIFIAHDLRMVEYVSTRIIVINQGRIVEIIPSIDINEYAIHPYTQTLLSAVPSIDEFDVNLLKRHHDPSEYEITNETAWWKVGKQHYVFGEEKQVYRWIRENKEQQSNINKKGEGY